MTRLFLVVGAVIAFGALASTTFGGASAAPAISIDVSSPVEATDGSGADVTYHVKSHQGLPVTCTPTGGPAAAAPGTTDTTGLQVSMSCFRA